MPRALQLPGSIQKTKARVCSTCALRRDPPDLCRRLVDDDGAVLDSVEADACRVKLDEIGQLRALCDGWRYENQIKRKG